MNSDLCYSFLGLLVEKTGWLVSSGFIRWEAVSEGYMNCDWVAKAEYDFLTMLAFD